MDCLKSEALKTEDTDQGRCFTFTPNDKIDHVGKKIINSRKSFKSYTVCDNKTADVKFCCLYVIPHDLTI